MSESQTAADGIDVAKRTATIQRVDDVHAPGSSRAYEGQISLFTEGGLKAGVPDHRKQFALVTISDDMADEIRGDLPDVDGTAVMLIGEHFGKNYHQSSRRTVPVDLLETMRDNDMVIVRGVSGGWANWDGRPEWSERYVDFNDAEVVDMNEEIKDRRDQ